MKRKFVYLLIILCLTCSVNQSYAKGFSFFHKTEKQKVETQKVEKEPDLGIYSVAKFFVDYETACNNCDKDAFLACYSKNYISDDGFNLSLVERILKDTWKHYPGIKYKVKLNSVNFYDDYAVANITETAKGYANTENNNIAEFVSTMQSVYYLKQKGNTWQIDADNVIKEELNIVWGDAKRAKIKLSAPQQISAGKEYTVLLSITQPEGVIAIGSINSDKITYPQKPAKEIFRKFSPDGTIERIMKANTENTNEYIVATVGFTRPKIDENKNLDVRLSGYACIMKRLNVIPINRFIEVPKDEQTK